MAYNANSYLPSAYSHYQYSQYVPTQQYMQPQSNTLTWIQGEAAAKSFPVTPGGSVLLLDSESPVFYIKTVDTSGMPLPLRVFDYTERTEATPKQEPEYITRQELEDRLAEFLKDQEPVKAPARREKTNA